MSNWTSSHAKAFTPCGSRIDPAAFNKDILRSIWGTPPPCLLISCNRAKDYYHIITRGALGKLREATMTGRTLLSSPYNAAPLSHEVHTHCPYLGMKEMQKVLLRAVYKHIANAINKGHYQQTALDKEFLKIFFFS